MLLFDIDVCGAIVSRRVLPWAGPQRRKNLKDLEVQTWFRYKYAFRKAHFTFRYHIYIYSSCTH